MRLHPLLPVALLLVHTGRSQAPALRGLDPVQLCRGVEQQGAAERTASHEGRKYRFVDDDSRATFLADPARWAIQLGGACARMGPLSGLGADDRWLVHDGRIYVFASDGCRDGFAKDPAAHLDVDLPRPETTAASREAAAALRARLDAAGTGWRTLRYRIEREDGTMHVESRVELRCPDGARVETDYVQGDRTWKFAQAAGPNAGGFVDEGEARPMWAAGRRELLRGLLREPATLLARLDDAVVTASGPRVVQGVAVDEFAVWLDGTVTNVGVDRDGRARTVRFRGRGTDLRFHEVVRVLDDFTALGGTVVPRTVRAFVDGAPAPALDERRLDVAIDVAIDGSRFEPGK